MTLTGSRRLVVEATAVATLVVAIHLVFRLTAGFAFGVYDDDGVYVALGKAIAQGLGYRSIHLVGAPVQVRYPPGLPLVLAIPWAVGGSLTTVRTIVSALHPVVVGGAAGLIWWSARRHLNIGRWPLAVCAISPLVLDPAIQIYNLPMSEPYFVLGWAAVLVLAFPLVAEEANGSPSGVSRPGRAGAVGLVLAATTLFRASGVALLVAVLVLLVLRRRRVEAAACALAAIVPLTGWAVLRASWIARGPVSTFPDDLGYWQWLGAGAPARAAGAAARIVAVNAVQYVNEFSNLLFPTRWLGVPGLCLAALVGVAAAILLWHRLALLGLTVLSVTLLILAWPYDQNRLVLPILPFLGMLVASGADWGIRRWPRRTVRLIHAAFGMVAVAVVARQVELRQGAERAFQTMVLPRPIDRSPTLLLAIRSVIVLEIAGWIRQHTTLQDRVMVQATSGVYLYTGRQTVSAIPTESPLAPSVFSNPGQYLAQRVLTDSLTVVVWTPATFGLARDIASVRVGCPQVLVRDPTSPATPIYYRVHRDEACLLTLARPSPPAR